MGAMSDVRIVACPDGPFLVRGADTITDESGKTHQVTRPVVAVCRCGKTARAPWCDGTHKVLTRAAAPVSSRP
jgi:CDGSH-type Zn-finger protein